jgi:hypothetical protein
MVVTPEMIKDLRVHGREKINSELEALILEQLGSEPYPYTYSEQDIYEQMRKLIQQYNEQHGLEEDF